MNRKGFLLGEETLKIVVAVICIVFLIYLLVSIYFSMSGAENIKFAQAIVNGEHGIAEEINRINLGGEYASQGFLVPNPSGWYIFSFAGEKKPNLCTGQNCLCVCGNELVNIFDRQIKQCDAKGACFIVPNLKEFEKIKIEKAGTTIFIQKVNEYIEIRKK